jgi:hypothetical protein
MLTQPFIYVNTREEYKKSDGGMIAPLCSPDLFELVLQGESPFTLAPEVDIGRVPGTSSSNGKEFFYETPYILCHLCGTEKWQFPVV